MSDIDKRLVEEQHAFHETQDPFEAAVHFARCWVLCEVAGLDEMEEFEEQVEEMRKRFGK